ncbi:MAG TPA: mechanosensitive ion channel domain-containing protein [Xanthobacteraceae bacterium]|nr:mechanosensitive ion channel domain-containing protein [Xanthobacteraceae bacterium]
MISSVISSVRVMLHVVCAVLLVGVVCARAQTSESAPQRPANAAQPDAAASPAPPRAAAPPPAQRPRPQINTAEITRRANNDMGVDIEATVVGWQRELDRIDGELRAARLRYSELNSAREALQHVRGGVEDFAGRLQPPLDAAKAQVELLGPAPADGQPGEPEQIALNRAELNYYLGLLSAARAAVNSAQLRIDQLINAVQDIRRRNFTSNLFQPVPGVYAPETWTRLPFTVPLATSRIDALVTDWWSSVRDHGEVMRIALGTLVLALVLMLVAWRGVPRLRRWRGDGEPPFWRRASSAAGVILLRILPAVAPIILLYVLVDQAQDLPNRIDWLFYAATQSAIVVFSVSALVVTVFAPAAPQWRLVDASDRAAWRICALVILLAAIYGLTTLAHVATRVVQAPFALTIAAAVPSCLLMAGIVIAILLTPLDAKHQGGITSPKWFKLVRTAVWVALAAIVASTLTGYVALSRFLTQQLIVTGSILALVYLMLLWVDGFTQGLGDDNAATGRWLRERGGFEQQRREQMALPVGLFLKFAVLVLSVPLIMLQWGYSWPDIYDWYRQLFFGFHIANTQVSFAALLASVIVFVLAFAAARLFQSWLDTRVLKPAGISGGVRDSIRTGVGYAGVILAAVVALSYAGFNLSSLAIVAGALSVGVGLGLQGVVNNFVSGLILLAERPIKVGDLVVVGGEEGTVRKISVRSTEIETGDRAHVVVPNSYFITEKVKNWTHRNSIGRIVIAVNVASSSDPRQTCDILLRLAKEHPHVMAAPEPFVDFDDFGADSLNFKLYAFTYDLTKNVSTRTDLRIAILDAFKQAGIRIAFLQTDVTVRNIDRLREAVSEYVSGPYNGKGAAQRLPPRPIAEAGG